MSRNLQKQATRAKILDTANALFAELGYEAVNTRLIAKEAGIANGTLFSHFKDKYELTKALFLAKLDDELANNKQHIAEAAGGVEYFSGHTLLLYQFYAKDRGLSKALLQQALFEQNYFAQQLQGFISEIAKRLLQELPHHSDEQRQLIALAWFGFYFFQLFYGLSSDHQPEQWHETLMSQCQGLLTTIR